jgi:hypothetical protein
VSITDRRRELVLRGGWIGRADPAHDLTSAEHRRPRLILGFAFGALNLYYILQIVQRDIAGMRLAYSIPMPTLAMLLPTILAAAFVAALWPAESAVHGSLVEALEYE